MKQSKYSTKTKTVLISVSPLMSSCLSKMIFFMDSFLFYLQNDVISQQFLLLKSTIKETTDFEKIKICHEEYLDALYTQCLLKESTISEAISQLINYSYNICLTFPTFFSDPSSDPQKFLELSHVISFFFF